MKKRVNTKGLSFVEMIVAVALFLMITAAGYFLLTAGQASWMITDAQIHMQENMRRALRMISAELQESGVNIDGVSQVVITDNGGAGGSDILRFAVPVCICYTRAINEQGDVRYWGAPAVWGQSGCTDDYPVENNGKVDICHHPPGNPGNTQNLNVSSNAVKAHLAHGDSVGDCGTCGFTNYSNRWVEYRLDAQGRMLRKVLDQNLASVAETIVADSFADFQAVKINGQPIVTLNPAMTRQAAHSRQLTMSGTLDVYLRNGN